VKTTIAILALALGGCDSGPPWVGSCDSRMDHTCTDYRVNPAEVPDYRDGCVSAGATWFDTLCNHMGSVGGCKSSTNGITAIVWYYGPDYTTDNVKQICTGGNFVTP
jgi:hypothetical protein